MRRGVSGESEPLSYRAFLTLCHIPNAALLLPQHERAEGSIWISPAKNLKAACNDALEKRYETVCWWRGLLPLISENEPSRQLSPLLLLAVAPSTGRAASPVPL